ncbi:hypothetical protein IW145_006490, partial [Coemansia sp. RSA 521]
RFTKRQLYSGIWKLIEQKFYQHIAEFSLNQPAITLHGSIGEYRKEDGGVWPSIQASAI